jgi:hypothetical protein
MLTGGHRPGHRAVAMARCAGHGRVFVLHGRLAFEAAFLIVTLILLRQSAGT